MKKEVQVKRRNLLTGMVAAGVLPSLMVSRSQAAVDDSAKTDALMGGEFATASSKLALTKGNSNLVKAFARLEIDEQAAVAEAFGSRPGAARLDRKHMAQLENLRQSEGAAFDDMYLKAQINGHEELLRIHRRYARRGADPVARGASTVAVPAIKTHLVMLKEIRRMAA